MGTVNALGVATYTYTAPAGAVGSVIVTASYAATGAFGASVSGGLQLTLSPAFVANTTSGTLNVAAGRSGTVNISLTPGTGYTGTVAMACSSPVAYITCSVSSASVTLNGSSATTVTGTIKVAATTSMLAQPRSSVYLAMLAPFGLLGLLFGTRKRRSLLRGAAVLLILLGVVGAVSGCSGGSPSSGSGTTSNAPTGTQIVNFTATGGGSTQTVQVVVTIQ
jgi:hypothetical protein